MEERVTEPEIRQIYRETVDALYGYVSRRCGGQREVAEDITQDTWLRAVREWRRVGVPNTPLAWLTTVARNLILNHVRRRVGVSFDSVSPAEVLAAVEDNAVTDSAEVASVMSRALTRLPEAEAHLLEAFHYERRKVSQLAEAYGISERAIEGRLRRAREHLRHEVEITLRAEGGIA